MGPRFIGRPFYSEFFMGNVLVHLCPDTSKLFRGVAKRGRNESDTDFLCSNVPEASSEQLLTSSDVVVRPSSRELPTEAEKPISPYGPKIIKQHIKFPFLIDDEVAEWIVQSRFMFILRGPPGCGKSFIAECIKIRFPMAKICSADNFWYLESNGAEYQFDLTRLAEAHRWCQKIASDYAEEYASPIVIDNTNVREWETRFYTDLAKQYHYTVIMVTPQTPWRFDTDALAMRNVHLVGIQAIEAKVRNFESVFPLYYGWIWAGAKSSNHQSTRTTPYAPIDQTNHILSWAWESLTTIIGLPDIRIQLSSAMGLPDNVPLVDILRYWRSSTQPAFGENLRSTSQSAVLHITSKFARFGRAPAAKQYGLSGVVMENLLGRLCTVQVTGLFFSLRTVGIRIRLPNDDLILHHLWASDDQTVLPHEQMEDLGFTANGVANIQHRRPIGCRAHVTLALADDVSPIETGFDLLRVVDSELANQPGDHVAIVPGGSVRRVTVRKPLKSPTHSLPVNFATAPPGWDYIYVYDLDFPQHHRVMFAGCY